MKINWTIFIPWTITVIMLLIIMFIISIPKEIDDNRIYMDPMNGISDSCNSGGIHDANGKYLTASKCYDYLGQTVADVKKDSATHGPNVTWSDIPKSNPNCHPRSENDRVAAVSINVPEDRTGSQCYLYSDSEIQLTYSATPNSDGGVVQIFEAPPGWGAAYDKRYASVNL